MIPNTRVKKEDYYQCLICGAEIYWNTRKQLTSCTCGAISIDGCEEYIRILGNERDYRVIRQAQARGLPRCTSFHRVREGKSIVPLVFRLK